MVLTEQEAPDDVPVGILGVMRSGLDGVAHKNSPTLYVICVRRNVRGSAWVADYHTLAETRVESIDWFDSITDGREFDRMEKRGLAKCVPCWLTQAT